MQTQKKQIQDKKKWTKLSCIWCMVPPSPPSKLHVVTASRAHKLIASQPASLHLLTDREYKNTDTLCLWPSYCTLRNVRLTGRGFGGFCLFLAAMAMSLSRCLGSPIVEWGSWS